MFRVLHTADWHLGKRLYDTDLTEDSAAFLAWLGDTIRQRAIDVILVSGDIFDTHHPPQEARKLYFNFLAEMVQAKCRVVITGGNHDSPAELNAPKDLLKAFAVDIVGGGTDDLAEQIITLKNTDGTTEALLCAVPFLRDRDLRRATETDTLDTRRLAVREGIARHYANLYALAHEAQPHLPVLAMGHLFVSGAATSDGDENLHKLGTLDHFEAKHFPPFAYIALGHIHRPQRIGKTEHIRYSGSPIGLDFSERTDKKIVITFCVEDKKVTDIEEITVPSYRTLLRLDAPLETIMEALISHVNPPEKFLALADVIVQETRRDPERIAAAKAFFNDFKSTQIRVASVRYRFEENTTALALFGEDQHLRELQPQEVFERWLTLHADPTSQPILQTAFEDLIRKL